MNGSMQVIECLNFQYQYLYFLWEGFQGDVKSKNTGGCVGGSGSVFSLDMRR